MQLCRAQCNGAAVYIAEKLVNKQSYTSIMGNIGASSAIISRVSRVLSRDDSVLRRLLEEGTAPADKTEV